MLLWISCNYSNNSVLEWAGSCKPMTCGLYQSSCLRGKSELSIPWSSSVSLGCLQVEQNADFRTSVAGCGAAPPPAVQRRGGGDCGPSLVHPGWLRDGVRLHDLVFSTVRRICGELRHASALQKLLVLAHQRRGFQLLSHSGTSVAPAHHADRSGRIQNKKVFRSV